MVVKRVECKFDKELVDRIDRVAALLKTNRTDIIRGACIAYLKDVETGRLLIFSKNKKIVSLQLRESAL
jgi:metal-responsive CopG/Arc/MetJ family transcriptional regulator